MQLLLKLDTAGRVSNSKEFADNYEAYFGMIVLQRLDESDNSTVFRAAMIPALLRPLHPACQFSRTYEHDILLEG